MSGHWESVKCNLYELSMNEDHEFFDSAHVLRDSSHLIFMWLSYMTVHTQSLLRTFFSVWLIKICSSSVLNDLTYVDIAVTKAFWDRTHVPILLLNFQSMYEHKWFHYWRITYNFLLNKTLYSQNLLITKIVTMSRTIKSTLSSNMCIYVAIYKDVQNKFYKAALKSLKAI